MPCPTALCYRKPPPIRWQEPGSSSMPPCPGPAASMIRVEQLVKSAVPHSPLLHMSKSNSKHSCWVAALTSATFLGWKNYNYWIRQPVDRGPPNIPGSALRKICSRQWWHQFPHCPPSPISVHTPQLLLHSMKFLPREGPQQASGNTLLLPTGPTLCGSDCGQIHVRGHSCEQ